jgi:hypothetical protein
MLILIIYKTQIKYKEPIVTSYTSQKTWIVNSTAAITSNLGLTQVFDAHKYEYLHFGFISWLRLNTWSNETGSCLFTWRKAHVITFVGNEKQELPFTPVCPSRSNSHKANVFCAKTAISWHSSSRVVPSAWWRNNVLSALKCPTQTVAH